MSLLERFINVAKRQRSGLAFLDRSTGRELTFSQSLIAALILARRFRRFPDRYIGILLPTSAGCGLSVLGIMLAGKIPVMLNYSTGARENTEFARRKCGFQPVITARPLLERVDCPELEGMIFIEDILKSVSLSQKVRAALAARLPTSWILAGRRPQAQDTAVILFTSGSEKEPKGVELSHGNILSDLEAIAEAVRLSDIGELHSDDKMLSVLPMFHVLGFTTTFWLPLLVGMPQVTLASPLEFRRIAELIKTEQPTIVIATPYFLMNYLKFGGPGDFSSLRLAVAGADKCPAWLHQAFMEQQNVEVCEGYGATETSPVVSVNLPGRNKPGSIGLPLPGVQVRIMDLDSGQVLPANHEGKIQVKGGIVMKGYFQDVEATALHIEDGWYETGDMGLLDGDGYLWHRGRLKRFIKIGGEMVSLVQIEAELERLLPEGCECCVVEVPDRKKGANIAVALTHEVDLHRLKKQLSACLPAIAQPRIYEVIPELPKTGSGKIDFRRATELMRQTMQR